MSQYTPEEEEQGRIAKEILMEKGKLSCEEMPKHTPTPWNVEPKAKLHEFQFQLLRRLLKDWPAGDIEFIVRAVNSHDALLDAAKKALSCLNDDDSSWSNAVQVKLVKAIAQAEGKS